MGEKSQHDGDHGTWGGRRRRAPGDGQMCPARPNPGAIHQRNPSASDHGLMFAHFCIAYRFDNGRIINWATLTFRCDRNETRSVWEKKSGEIKKRSASVLLVYREFSGKIKSGQHVIIIISSDIENWLTSNDVRSTQTESQQMLAANNDMRAISKLIGPTLFWKMIQVPGRSDDASALGDVSWKRERFNLVPPDEKKKRTSPR